MFLRILNMAECSTAPGANAAWSIETNALAHLTIVRNYFAHRNRDTALRVKRLRSTYRIGSTTRPEELLLARARDRPQMVVEDWLDDLTVAIELMPA
jgi:tRNA uridine 5-carbamoylmethylation protein Kti12